MASRHGSPSTPLSASGNIRLTACGVTDTGRLRNQNEDAFLCETTRGVLLIADGMGGLARGDVASRQVVSSVSAALAAGQDLVDGLKAAHSALLRMTAEARGHEPMGSTAVALSWASSFSASAVSVIWIGDSRAYRWRNGVLEQLTRDHSLVQDLLDMGAISAADAEHHPNRNVITRALGVYGDQPLQIDSAQVTVCPGDRLLLCSDGLSSFLPEARVCEVMAEGGDDEQTAKRLVQLTLDETRAGDNVTVICASVRSSSGNGAA